MNEFAADRRSRTRSAVSFFLQCSLPQFYERGGHRASPSLSGLKKEPPAIKHCSAVIFGGAECLRARAKERALLTSGLRGRQSVDGVAFHLLLRRHFPGRGVLVHWVASRSSCLFPISRLRLYGPNCC